MTTFTAYGAIRFAIFDLAARFDPKAPPVAPTAWENFRIRLRDFF